MATWDDVDRLAAGFPEVTTERNGFGWATWRVRRATFVWERPLGKRDLEELGADAPDGPVLAARLSDEGAKHALVAEDSRVYFTTSHFDGHPIVLVDLERVDVEALRELLGEAWVARAPQRLVRAYEARAEGDRG